MVYQRGLGIDADMFLVVYEILYCARISIFVSLLRRTAVESLFKEILRVRVCV